MSDGIGCHVFTSCSGENSCEGYLFTIGQRGSNRRRRHECQGRINFTVCLALCISSHGNGKLVDGQQGTRIRDGVVCIGKGVLSNGIGAHVFTIFTVQCTCECNHMTVGQVGSHRRDGHESQSRIKLTVYFALCICGHCNGQGFYFKT